MLHNICKNRNIDIPEEEQHLAAFDGGNEVGLPVQEPQRRREGLLYRDAFAELHFK